MPELIVTVHVNGVDDDTEALQAFIDGRVISFSDGTPLKRNKSGVALFIPGDYLVHAALEE